MSNTLKVNTFKTIPQSPHDQNQPHQIMFPEPVSYEFQVVEYVNDDFKIVRVELQVKENIHDQYGNVTVRGTWKPVPRVQFPA
jgi:hypothetical protein